MVCYIQGRAWLPRCNCPPLVVHQESLPHWEGFQFAFQLSFILFIIILHEGQEGAHLASIYSHSVFPFCILLHFVFGLAADTAVWKPLAHFDSSDAEVDL